MGGAKHKTHFSGKLDVLYYLIRVAGEKVRIPGKIATRYSANMEWGRNTLTLTQNTQYLQSEKVILANQERLIRKPYFDEQGYKSKENYLLKLKSIRNKNERSQEMLMFVV